MLQTFVIGLGHAGAGLHLPVLRRARALAAARHLFSDGPVIAWDPRGHPCGAPPGVVVAASVTEAAQLLEPDGTVVHVCTPPSVRSVILEQLADPGFRKVIVEKPLAVTEPELAEITRLAGHRGLHLAVVAQWLSSSLTMRLLKLVLDNRLGALRSMSIVQHKPRFSRTPASRGHPTAFDVEMPHSVGVALRLAGAAMVSAAECDDLTLDGAVIPSMGGARLALRHAAGIRTEIASDLTSPVRARRIALRFEHGVAVGHYPASRDDDYAQLHVTGHGNERHSVFRDDALTSFLLRAYERFATRRWASEELDLQADVVRLLCTAKELSARGCQARTSPSELVDHAR